ncbi:unnamed protein product [Phytomonas sp. EM1]|nr:unnamed protein product [Phytomonas sp. EM1]|eukprot:CCW64888.1 unnamed protein product [Phytomonas sp. isolate EM1]
MTRDASVDVAFLLVNGFRQCGAQGIPAPNVVIDALISVVPLASHLARENGSADSPYTKALENIALSFPSSSKDATPLDMISLQEQIRNLVSFPEQFASYCATLKDSTADLLDSGVYLAKLYDAVWSLCLPKRPSEDPFTSSQVMALLYVFASIAASRSDCKVLLERLMSIPLAQNADDKSLLRHLIIFTKGMLSGSLNRKFCSRNKTAPSRGHTLIERANSCWRKWMNFLLRMGAQKSDWKRMVAQIFASIALGEEVASCDTDSAVEDSGTSALFISDELVCTFVRQFIFREAISTLFTPRMELKFLFEVVFPSIWAAGEKGKELVAGAEECVLKAWDCSNTVLSGTLLLNETLLNSVMYFMLFWTNISETAPSAEKRKFPPKILSFFLDGITLRLDSVHRPLQKAGMVAAAAFAKLFVDSAEAVEGLLKNESFSLALEDWMQGESVAIPSANHKASSKSKNVTESEQMLLRTEAAQMQRYPLDPDEGYYFFALQGSSRETNEGKVEGEFSVVDQPRRSHFPTFGVQKIPSDETDVAILQTFRASYEALVGIGRSPSAQLYEVQQSIEAGLEGMLKALHPMKERKKQLRPLPFLTQVDPLIPSLIPTLMLLSIHATDQKQENLYHKRFLIIVDLIVVSPRASLRQLSTMIYGSNYAIYQRSEMIKAVGEAAKIMSRVEILEDSEGLPEKNDTKKKRIYPPIESHPLKSQTSLMEGKNTRRWGNAVEGRKTALKNRKRYRNLLGDEAPFFFSCLLARLDREHFKFFQTTDPFTPSEVLRTLVVIFQSLTQVRHIIVPLCESNFDFFVVAATQHPHLEVRKQGWIVLGELMRSWCGAFPIVSLVEKDPSPITKPSVGYQSLMFTESWMEALQTLQFVCEEARKKNDPCWGVAAITVSSLSDIIQEKSDFNTLQSSAEIYIRV